MTQRQMKTKSSSLLRAKTDKSLLLQPRSMLRQFDSWTRAQEEGETKETKIINFKINNIYLLVTKNNFFFYSGQNTFQANRNEIKTKKQEQF